MFASARVTPARAPTAWRRLRRSPRPRSGRDRAPTLPGSPSGRRRPARAPRRCRSQLVERLRARGECDDLEVRVRVDDLERLPPDRAGGPEQRDPLEIGGHESKANRRCVQNKLRSPHRALAAPLRRRREPVRRAVSARRGRTARQSSSSSTAVTGRRLRLLVDDGALRGPRRQGSPPGTSSTGVSGTAAAGPRRSPTSPQESTC